MVQVITVPASAGIPPIPQGATNVSQRGGGGEPSDQGQFVAPPAGGLPADQLLTLATQGQAPAQAPAGVDAAEFAAFQAWKASQGKAPAPVAPVAPTAQTAVPVSPTAALDTTLIAAKADPILNSMLTLLDKSVANLDRSRAIGNALTYGDPNLVDVAYLTEIGGANAASLIEIAKGVVGHATASADAAAQSIYAKAGSEANWNAASAAFNKGAPQHLKQFVAYSLNSGDRAQIEAAATTVVEFARNSGLMPVAPTGQVNSGGGAPGSTQALSKAQFQAEHAKLDRNARGYEEARGELMGRRQLGIQMGL